MTTQTVQIVFRGVCTHFHNIVPGVPHRVVLPDASAFRVGLLQVASNPTVSYFLMPHFPILRVADETSQAQLEIEHVMVGGNIIDGVHLRIANPVSASPPVYMASYLDLVPRITTFVSDYVPSSDVIEGQRAAVYFDLFEGTICKGTAGDGAVTVIATVETDGPPVLLATPFGSTQSFEFPLTEDDEAEVVPLVVANQGMDCASSENNFDFLLHYLTARPGIPRNLIFATPGMGSAQQFTETEFDNALTMLATLDFPHRFEGPCFATAHFLNGEIACQPDVEEFVTSLACSDTRYP